MLGDLGVDPLAAVGSPIRLLQPATSLWASLWDYRAGRGARSGLSGFARPDNTASPPSPLKGSALAKRAQLRRTSLSGELLHLMAAASKFWHTHIRSA